MFLVALAATIAEPETVFAQQAKAVVRILKSAEASAANWNRAPASDKRETTIRGERGETIVIRLIEHQ